VIVKAKGGYVVKSHDGKKALSKVLKSHAAAVKRLKQVEWFKHKGGAK
jgi:hypothetical protein